MLAPVSRFRYTKTYAYGATAFVAGFAAVMALLVHFSPVQVANSLFANASEKQQPKQESAEVKPATAAEQTESTTTNPTATSSMMITTPSQPSTPAVDSTPAAETPSTPVETTPTTPTTPVETTPVETTPEEPTPTPTPEPPVDTGSSTSLLGIPIQVSVGSLIDAQVNI